MKKILALFDRPAGILLVALVLGFYGCGGAPDTADSAHEEEHDHEHGEDHDHEHEEEHDHEHEHEEGEDHDHEHDEDEDHDHEHADGEDHDHDHEHGEGEHEHGHHHTAPHGGTLVALGDHFAHLEIVLDSTSGVMTVYVLDGEAENPIRLEQESMEFTMALKNKEGVKAATMLEASPVENTLTGETVGDTSEFKIESEKLIGIEEFSAVVSTLEVKGETIDDIEFDFPEGNE